VRWLPRPPPTVPLTSAPFMLEDLFSSMTGRSSPRRAPSRVSATLGTSASAVTAALVGATAVMTGYLGVLTVAGIARRRRERRPAPDRARHHFAICVPAHDEAAVIGRALASFAALDYPRDHFQVHVVADNCTDETAQIVRAAGFEAHERRAPDDPGKGAALNWLLQRVDQYDVPPYARPDAFVFVDADTTIDPAFLTEMDAALHRGVEAAQGYYAVSDPDASTAAGLRYAALACRHHLRPLGRCRLGASCGLYGNGMVFTAAAMEGRRWSGHLVEDAEFQMELLLDGRLVQYVPEATLQAEMPDSLDGSVTQNRRWELGRIQLARRFVPTLLRRVVRPAGAPRVAYVDAVLDHVVPPLSVLALVQLGGCATSGALALGRGRRADRMSFAVAVLSMGTLTAHVLGGLWSVGAPRSVYRSLLGAPRSVLWKAGLWLRVLQRPDEVAWVRTERNRPEVAA
jgi:glycosyltransferase involved in cell wall biosynthesis